MNKREMLKRVSKAAKAADLSWNLDRQGGNHEVYSLDGLMIPVPRHNEIGERLAVAIWKECEPKLGKGWWR
jgi:hypothetical protein